MKSKLAERTDYAQNDSAGAAPKPMRIAVIASLAYSLTNFRLELLKAMILAGHEVFAFAPDRNARVVEKLRSIGATFIEIPMDRTGMDPIKDIATLHSLYRHFRQLKPDIVLPYTMKPVIYGGIAARMAGIPKQFALMTGLGYIFSDDEMSLRKGLVRRISVMLYRFGLKRADKLFVYNSADSEDIHRHRMIVDYSKLVPVAGSGVDLDLYKYSVPAIEPVKFLLIARLLKDKGIREFVQAAREIRKRNGSSQFQILGPLDSNPAGITRDEVDGWVREGAVDYLGETNDVRPYLAGCSVFVLPSYYREGIPRTILEALATGRAIVTSDMPGCRETVVSSENGYLVEPRNVSSLVEAMEKFVEDPDKITNMGKRSHEIARDTFDVHKVNRHLLTEMSLI